MSAQSNSSCHVQSSSERQREGPGGRSQEDSNTPQIQKQRDNEVGDGCEYMLEFYWLSSPIQ